jgi:predicted DNA-binding transcriptional regulator AlpA
VKKQGAPPGSTPHTNDALDTLVDDRDLDQRGFFTRSTRYRMVQDGRFPEPLRLSSGAKRWRWSSIQRWLEEREANPVQARSYHRVWKHPRKAKAAADATP